MRDTQRLLGGDGAHAGSRSSQPPLLTAHSASLGGAVAGALLAMLLSGGGIALLWGDDDSLWTITLFCVSLVGWLIVMGVLAAHFVELRGKQHKKGKVKTLFFLFTVALGLWFVVVLGCLIIFIPLGLATITNSGHTWGWGLLGGQIVSVLLQIAYWYSYNKYYKDLQLHGDITTSPDHELARMKPEKSSRRGHLSLRRSKSKSSKRSSTPRAPPLDSRDDFQHARSPSPPSPVESAVSYNSTGGAPLREPSTRSALHVVNASPNDSAPSDDDGHYHGAAPPSTYSPFSQPQGIADHSVSDDDTFHLPRNSTSSSSAPPYDPHASYDAHSYHSHYPMALTPGRRPDQPDWRPPRPSQPPIQSSTTPVWRPSTPLYLRKPDARDSLPSRQPKSRYDAYNPGSTPTAPLVVPRAASPTSSPTYASDWRPTRSPATSTSPSLSPSPYYPSSTPDPAHRRPLASPPPPRSTPLPPGQRPLPSFADARRDSATAEKRSVSPDSLPPMPEYHRGDQYHNVHSLGRRRSSRSLK